MLSGPVLISAGIEALCSAGLFITLWVVLGNNLFKPYFRLLEDREARTSGDERRAIELTEMSADVKHSIEEELRGTRLQGLAARDAAVAKSKEEARRVVDEATARALAELETARGQIEQLKAKARVELAVEAEALSKTLLSRLLSERGAQTIH